MAKRDDYAPGTGSGESKVSSSSKLNQKVQLAQAESPDQTQPFDLASAPIRATFTATSPGARIALPEGTSIDRIMVKDGNLYLVQPDGSVIVIEGGATFVPTLVLAPGLTITAEQLQAALKGAEEGVPTAAPKTSGPDSGGGDFAVDPGSIGSPFDLSNLLPPTELPATELPVFEIGELIETETEELLDQALGALALPSIGTPEDGRVEEDDLREGVNEDNSVGAFTVMGSLGADFGPDGPGTIQFAPGLTAPTGLTSRGQQLSYEISRDGTLLLARDSQGNEIFAVRIDPIVPGGKYTFTLIDRLDHPPGPGTSGDPVENFLDLGFDFVVTDASGDSVQGRFTVSAQDDVPVALNQMMMATVSEANVSDVSDRLYFQAPGNNSTDGNVGEELYVHDPVAGTTTLVADLDNSAPGRGSSPGLFTELGGKLYFRAHGSNTTDGDVGDELYVHDPLAGTTTLVADLNALPPSANSTPGDLTVVGGKLYFSAAGNNGTDGNVGRELYVHDPVAGTTTLVADLNTAFPGASSFPGSFTELGGKLYFQALGNNATDGNVGFELYVHDPATGTTTLVADLDSSFPGASAFPGDFTVLGGKLYFSAIGKNTTDGNVGRELYVHDPATGTTTLVGDLNTSAPGVGSFPSGLRGGVAVLDGKLYFSAIGNNATDGNVGLELYVYDPGSGAFSLVADLNTSAAGAGSDPEDLTVLDGKLYFSATGNNSTDGIVGRELYVHDPATGTTTLVANLNTASPVAGSGPQDLTVLDGKLYFQAAGDNATDGNVGSELYVHDPVTGTTTLVADLDTSVPGSGSAPFFLTALGGKLYFRADGNNATDGAVGSELYVHDPATGTTSLVADLFDGVGGSFFSGIRGLTAVPGTTGSATIDVSTKVNFGTDGPATGGGFGLKDVTAGGTLTPAVLDANGNPLTASGNPVVFSSFTSVNGVSTLTAKAGGVPVFTLTMTSAGQSTFTLFDELDHPLPGTDQLQLDVSQFITATDFDGDTIMLNTGTVIYKVDDDVPTVVGPMMMATVKEADLSSANGKLYFSAVGNNATDGNVGRELYVHDPVAGTTALVADLTDAGNSFPGGFIFLDGKLYFTASVNNAIDGNVGRELYVYDPETGTTTLVADLNTSLPGRGSFPDEITVLDGKLYFEATGNNATDGNVGDELYVHDPATGTTTLVADLDTSAPGARSGPTSLTVLDGKLYFSADGNNATDDNVGRELYVHDPVAGTTTLVANLADTSPGEPSSPGSLTVLGGKLYFSADGNNGTDGNVGNELYVHDPVAGTTTLVADLNTSAVGADSNPRNLTVLDGKLYFVADGNNTTDGDVGRELYVHDPVAGTTTLVADLDSSAAGVGSGPEKLTVLGGKLYFTAEGNNAGRELYVHDPFTGTTTLVADLDSSVSGAGSDPDFITALDGKLYFTATGNNATDGDVGRELYVHDPATGTTTLVADLNSSSVGAGSNPRSLTVQNGKLYFSADGNNTTDGNVGRELYVHDPATGTTTLVADLNNSAPGANSSPVALTGVPNLTSATIDLSAKVDFGADGPATGGGFTLNDVTVGGTVTPAVLDNSGNPLTASGNPVVFSSFTTVNGVPTLTATAGGVTVFTLSLTGQGQVTFTLFDELDHPLRGTDQLQIDVSALVTATDFDGDTVTLTDDLVIFKVDDDVPTIVGQEMTATVSEARLIPDNLLYFSANGNNATDGNVGTELYEYDPDGSAQPRLVADLNTGVGADAFPRSLTVIDGKLYFTAFDPSAGQELFVYDPNSGGTPVRLTDINAGSGNSGMGAIIPLGGKIYFSAVGNNPTDGNVGREVYVHDPATSTTTLFADINPGPDGSFPNQYTVLDGKLYFSANNGSGSELFVLDPAAGTTTLVADLNSAGSAGITDLTVLGGKLYFAAEGNNSTDGNVGHEVYVHDPATGLTTLVADLFTGPTSSFPSGLTAFDGKLYFSASNGSGLELFVHDPIAGTTTLVADLNIGGSGAPFNFAELGGKLYFSANGNNATDGNVGWELYVLDPSSGGTPTLVANLNAAGDANPRNLTGLDGKLYFTADDGVNGVELYVFDPNGSGPPALVANLNPTGSANPRGLTAVDGKLYFSADDGVNGFELYEYDPNGSGPPVRVAGLNTAGGADPTRLTPLTTATAVSATIDLSAKVDFGADGPGGVNDGLAFVDVTIGGSRTAPVSDTNGNPLTASGEAVVYSSLGLVNGIPTLTATAAGVTVFTLSLIGDSKVIFTLFEELDHPLPGTDQIGIDIGGLVFAIDGDGDIVTLPTGLAIFNVDDDVPTIVGQAMTATVSEANVGTDDFLVHTTTQDDQRDPSITPLANGGFAVVWVDQSQSGGDTSFSGIRGRVFNADGTPVTTTDFLVNTVTTDRQVEPVIAALPNGGFVVVWEDNSQSGGDSSEEAIRGRVFNADGTPVNTTDFLINTATFTSQFQPVITALPGGGFVVAWTDTSGSVGDTFGFAVRGRVFNADGTPVNTTDFVINTATANNQSEPVIEALSGGGFVVAWTDLSETGGDTSLGAIRGRLFDANGNPLSVNGSTDDFLINTTTEGNQVAPKITALTNGGFAVIWDDFSLSGADTSGQAIRGRVFNADGTPVNTNGFLVNTATANNQSDPQLTALPGGGFVVTWVDFSRTGGDSFFTAIRGRVFDADGTPVNTNDFLVNTTTLNGQFDPVITALPGGGFVVAWEDYSSTGSDTSVAAIRGRVFNADGTPATTNDFLVNTTTPNGQFDPIIEALPGGGFVVTWVDFSQSGGDTSGAAVRARVFDADGTPVSTTSTTLDLSAKVDFGADGPATGGGFALDDVTVGGTVTPAVLDNSGNALKSGGAAVQFTGFSTNGNVTTLTAEADGKTIFTLSLTSDGQTTFTLFEDLDHNGAAQLELDVSALIAATDFDGDVITLPDDFSIFKVDNDPSLPNYISGDTGVSDILTGTSAADIFVIDDLTAIDQIVDYQEQDSVDLSELLEAAFDPSASNPADFVRLNGNNLEVDTDGGGNSFQTAATFNSLSGINIVNVILNDDGGSQTNAAITV